ncbi:MAG: chromosomal replication initiator protein DnaA [Clostridia bacterium]|nr:chromosomal replication initiator protein DnaA [Clostridia bacterium]
MFTAEEIKNIWTDVKKSFVDNNKFAPSTVDLWFKDLYVQSFENEKIIFISDSKYKTGFINEKYIETISEGFEEFLGFLPKIEVIFKEKNISENISEDVKEQYETSAKENKSEGILKSGMPTLNFEYTFESFIEGNSNTFARAACWAVAKNVADAEEGSTASQYNPLFLYGPSGIGKTHLMYAITNKIRKEKPDATIVYIKGEDFTNQLIDSLAKQTMHLFREKYRMCDILMIDDIQFMANKVATQEEFFHTFNALYENEKQIIMTSDRPPREIPDLEKRLVSRFEMGLLADIQPPDLELRIAIIKKKAEQGNVSLPDEVLTFLAENLRSNIRQIEGAIKKLSALCFLSGKQITIDLAKNLLHELLGGAEPISVTVDKIFLAVYKKYGFKKEELTGTKRTKDLAFARHISIYLIRQITEMSLSNIGKIFKRDHSTVMASIEKVESRISKENIFAIEISELMKEVENIGN